MTAARLGIALVLAAGACASLPPAPRERNDVESFFQRYDTNRDGVISWEEAQQDPDLLQVFQRADANGDGVLDRTEFRQAAVLAVKNRRAGGAAGAGS